MIYYYFNDIVLSENIIARRRVQSCQERGTMAAVELWWMAAAMVGLV